MAFRYALPMIPDFVTDNAWLAAYREGDRAALRRVFDTYVDAVDIIIRRGTVTKDGSRRVPGIASAEGIEDVVQDVFVKVFAEKTRRSYDAERPFLPFIRQIARHTLIDYHRKHGRTRLIDDVESEELLWIDGPLPADDLLAKQQLVDAVREFKALLAPEDQQFVAMRFVDGMGQRDVAEQLNMTRTAVRKRDEELRDRLRAFLKERGRSDQD